MATATGPTMEAEGPGSKSARAGEDPLPIGGSDQILTGGDGGEI